jgi:hypothetical protein
MINSSPFINIEGDENAMLSCTPTIDDTNILDNGNKKTPN